MLLYLSTFCMLYIKYNDNFENILFIIILEYFGYYVVFLTGLFKSSRDEGLSVTNWVFLLAPINELVPLKHCLYNNGGNIPTVLVVRYIILLLIAIGLLCLTSFHWYM